MCEDPLCRRTMIKSLIFYKLYDVGNYVVAESMTPRSNVQGKSLPKFNICKQCFYDYQLQKLETVVAF